MAAVRAADPTVAVAAAVQAIQLAGPGQGPRVPHAARRAADLKVWQPDERDLGRRERETRAAVAAIPECRSPQALASGRSEGIDYLLERVVYGRHPAPGAERMAAALQLVPALATAYQRHGVTDRRLSRIVHHELGGRLATTLNDPELPWDPAWGSRSELLRRLDRLIERNLTVPCSLGHGDLVSSNIIRTSDGHHVLIDWEFAGVQPVAFDLGKLLFASGDPAAATTAPSRH